MRADTMWRGHAHRSDLHQGSKVGNQSISILWRTQGSDCMADFLHFLAVVTDDSLCRIKCGILYARPTARPRH
eukprot:887097-Pyramimonas_sp.AAC.1